MTSSQNVDTSDREIVISRVFDAPPELVFSVWSDPKHLIQWWGPDGFTNTFHEFDFRPGGVWLFVMHGPDGTDYDNKVTFLEIDPPHRLVYDHGDPDEPMQFRATVTFEAEGDKTNVTMRSLFPSVEARDYVIREVGAVEGGKQTLGRLAEYLQTL